MLTKTAGVSWSQILLKHQLSLDLDVLENELTEGSVVGYICQQAEHTWLCVGAQSKNATHHFDTKSWKSLEKTPSGSLGGG